MTKSVPQTSAGTAVPQFADSDRKPIKLTEVVHPDGRISQYPHLEVWEENEFWIQLSAKAWESSDPDTSRIWWSNVGVNQNLAHAVHPDPISGVHCWLQKVMNIRKAEPNERAGDLFVDTNKSMQKYREWLAMTRPADKVSPDGNRRPYWLARPLKPTQEAYKLPK